MFELYPKVVIVVARRAIVGESHVMYLDARDATRTLISDCVKGENKGEKNNKGEKKLRARTGAFVRFPQP